jgi:hypothetical protein
VRNPEDTSVEIVARKLGCDEEVPERPGLVIMLLNDDKATCVEFWFDI